MKIVKEEIFGPVGVVIKFEDEAGMLLFFDYWTSDLSVSRYDQTS